MYFDDDRNLNVYLVEKGEPLRSEDIDARRVQIEGVLADVIGKDFLTQGRAQRSALEEPPADKRVPVIKIVEGDYDIIQLVNWRAGVDRVLAVPGVIFTDLDERTNRLKVGIEATTSREQIEATLKKEGVPLESNRSYVPLQHSIFLFHLRRVVPMDNSVAGLLFMAIVIAFRTTSNVRKIPWLAAHRDMCAANQE